MKPIVFFLAPKSDFIDRLKEYLGEFSGLSISHSEQPPDLIDQNTTLLFADLSTENKGFVDYLRNFRSTSSSPIVIYRGNNETPIGQTFMGIEALEVITGNPHFNYISEIIQRHLQLVPKERVIVVEDEPAMLEILTLRLKACNYEVLPLSDGLGFITNVRTFLPDLIILDIMLPGKSGLDLCTDLKAEMDLDTIPVIFLTARNDSLTKLEAFKRGAIDYVTKPFNIHELLARVKAMLAVSNNQKRLLRLSVSDSLTGVLNRRALMEHAVREIKCAKRYRYPVSCLMIDIDHFKAVNDTHGHLAGDIVLREFAAMILHLLREVDIAGRFGGEEFLCILPHTGKKDARVCAERILREVREHIFKLDTSEIAVTASIGIAEYYEDSAESVNDLIQKADTALYKAKHGGRDKVEEFSL